MRTHAKEKASPVTSEGVASKPSENPVGKGNWFRLHWRLLSLFAIIIIAFLFRFVFAYGISAGDNYALSGGSSASSHLRVITEILAGTYNPANEVSLNYPIGTASISGPFFDYVMAALAWLVTLFGVSDATAAAGVLAWSAPIFGVLTCVPVFLLAKKLFKDEVIALASALFYAVFAALIMTSAFSNGTEYPLLCFLIAWLVYFVASAFGKADELNATGIKSVFTLAPVRTSTLVAAVFMALIILTWTGFWAAVMVVAVMLLVASIVQRIGGKDLGVIIGVSVVVLAVGIIVGAAYYVPLGLWEGIYRGGCLLAVLTVCYALLFLALEKKPWVFSIPVTAVVMVVVAAVLAFVVPEVSHDILSGSVPLTGSLALSLADQFSRTSISTMAAYYGWLTVWFPLFCGLWMAYKFRAHSKSVSYLFTMLWMFACFFVGWFSTEYAVLAGAGFAIGSGYVVVTLIRKVDMRSYLKSLRGNGFKAGAKKALNFFPLVTLIVAVFLVAVPTAVYAVDASTPTNDEHGDYFGGLGYTVNTSDSTLMNRTWNHYTDISKDGALVSWYGYSDAANQIGKFSTVTSSNGGGTSAMASTYLSNGSSGALASLITRLLENDVASCTTILEDNGVAELADLITDNDKARAYIADHADDFVQYNTNPSSESLPYLAGVHYLTSNLDGSKLADLYDALCTHTGNKIGYIEVDSSMIPIYANDGSYASTIAYFGDYAFDGSGTPSNLYSISSTTQAYYRYGYYSQLYYTYSDAMYETFLWNALMGVTPSDFGLSSSLELLSQLSNSDGTVKAQPGTGIDNFKIAYWHVMYRATEDGEWADMDAHAAIAKQNAEGGYINYLSSVIMYEYVGNQETPVSGTVTDAAGNPVAGVKVAVFEKVDYDSKSQVSYIQHSTTYTGADGKFNVYAPSGSIVKYYVGSDSLRGGTCVYTANSVENYQLVSVHQSGVLVDSVNNAFLNSNATVSFVGSDGAIKGTAVVGSDGIFRVDDLVPDVYTINVYGKDGSLLNSVSSVAIVESLDNLYVNIGAAKTTVTVNDMFGKEIENDVTVSIVGANGLAFEYQVSGTKEVYLPIGSYTAYVKGDSTHAYVSVQAKTFSLEKSSSTATVTLCAYEASSVASSAGSVWASLGFSMVSDGSTVYLPKSLDGALTQYTGSEAKEVSGVLKNSLGNGVSGTVAFISSDGKVFVFSADSDGMFNGRVPDNAYTIYATNNSQAVYKTIGNGSTLTDLELKMNVAYSVTANVVYNTNMSPSSVGLAFVPITFTVKSGETTYQIPAVSDSSGSFKLYVPKDSDVKYTVAKDPMVNAFGEFFNFVSLEDSTEITFQSPEAKITSNTSLGTFTIAAKEDASKNSVKAIDKNDLIFNNESGSFTGKLILDAYAGSDYDLYLEVNSGTIGKIHKYVDDTIGDEIQSIWPGRYTVTVYGDDTQFIDSQKINIYPDTKKIILETVSCFKVGVTKTNYTDTVTVILVEDNGGNKGAYFKKDNDYYLKNGYEYCFKITDTDGKIYYKFVNSAETISGYTLAEKKVLKGYVGANVDGKLNILGSIDSESVTVQVDVSKGAYTVDLPNGFAVSGMTLIAAKGESGDYTYTASVVAITSFTIDDDTTFNLSSTTSRDMSSDTVTVASADMNNGRASVTLTVKNNNEYNVTYYVEGNGALALDKVYIVSVPANGSASIVVNGYYNPNVIGAGNSDMTIEVKAIDGTSIGKVVVDKDYNSDISGNISVVYSGTDGVSDAADGYSYKYAIRFTNGNSTYKSVTVDLNSLLSEDWYVMLVDSSGMWIQNLGTSFSINGLGDTLLYVMLINKSGDSSAEIPQIEIKISGDYTETGKILSPESAIISSTDHSVTGAGAENEAKSLSAGFWILTVIAILLLLVTIWGGMKRGVFSRKN